MNKRSFWQRTNRGFVITMILLVFVVVYVAITQIQLAQEQERVREVTRGVQEILVDTLELSLDDMRTLQDPKQAVAYREELEEDLADLFVEDAAYLDDTLDQIVTLLTSSYANEREFSSLEEKRDESVVQIDENTAVAELDLTYGAKGSWLIYNSETDAMETQTVDTDLHVYCRISLLQQEGQWKIYRIHTMDQYSQY